MAVIIKTASEIESMRKSGKILAKVAEEIIAKHNAKASFKGFKGFPSSLCVCINEEIVHGLPSTKKIIQEGDLVTIDCGVFFEGMHTDAARSIQVGTQTKQIQQMLEVANKALAAGISQAIPGNFTNDISAAIEKEIKSGPYHIIHELTGHGVGKKVHEDPSINNYVDRREKNIRLETGMTLAIEPIFAMGSSKLFTGSDKWTLITQDLSTAIQVEETIVITEKGPEILTKI